jgi:hypothetical protein
MARKRVAKKLKVTETTSQEVNSSSRVVEYLSSMLCMLTTKFRCLQEIPPSGPVDQGTKATGRRWGSRLEEAIAQPPS